MALTTVAAARGFEPRTEEILQVFSDLERVSSYENVFDEG
jgi:hypothetical protein